MKDKELMLIIGGASVASISGTVLNAVVRAVNAALEVGRSLGTAIRRIKTGQICTAR